MSIWCGCETNPNAVFVHIGTGEEQQEMEKKIKELGIEGKYVLLGARRDVSELYQGMDAFLFPSISEGFGFALLEAQTAGLPCFVSTGIPKEAGIIQEQVEFISLEKSSDEWAKCILKKVAKFERKDVSEYIKQCGYDSKTNAEVVADRILDSV